MSLGVVSAASSMVMAVIGVGERTLSVMTREPVTVTSSSSESSVAAVGVAPCAQTVPAGSNAVPRIAAIETCTKRLEVIPLPSRHFNNHTFCGV
jgi:hypothetical protein